MGTASKIENQTFGKLLAIEKTIKRTSSGTIIWKCRCECGQLSYVPSNNLKNGHTTSCGTCWKQLAGQSFGKLVVISKTSRQTKRGETIWLCRCECGNQTQVQTSHLTSGHSTTCGFCIREMDKTAKKFGLLTVLEKSIKKGAATYWKCQCECGNVCFLPTGSLGSSNTKSCGCLRKSYGERLIEKHLSELKLPFEREYKFPDCRYKRPLPFDFCIFQKDQKFLIEFQGFHHYRMNKRFGKQRYLDTIRNDKIKSAFCIENKIPLLPIPYTKIKETCLLINNFLGVA